MKKQKTKTDVSETRADAKVRVKLQARPDHGTIQRDADMDSPAREPTSAPLDDARQPQAGKADPSPVKAPDVTPSEASKPKTGQGPITNRTRASGHADNDRPFDMGRKLADIRRSFKAYVKHGAACLTAVLSMGAILAAIKHGIKFGGQGFPTDITWEGWCDSEHEAGNLPFGRRQADRYIAIHRKKDNGIALEGDDGEFSIRTGLKITEGNPTPSSSGARETWQPFYKPNDGQLRHVHFSSDGRVRVVFPGSQLINQVGAESSESRKAAIGAVYDAVGTASLAFQIALLKGSDVAGALHGWLRKLSKSDDPIGDISVMSVFED